MFITNKKVWTFRLCHRLGARSLKDLLDSHNLFNAVGASSVESAKSIHGDREEGNPLLLASLKENVLPLELVCWAGFSVALDNLEILYLIHVFLTWVWSKDVGVVEDGTSTLTIQITGAANPLKKWIGECSFLKARAPIWLAFKLCSWGHQISW